MTSPSPPLCEKEPRMEAPEIDTLWLCAGQSNMVWPFAWMPEAAKQHELTRLGDGPLRVTRVPDRAWIEREAPRPVLSWVCQPREELPAIPAFLSSALCHATGQSHGMVVSAIGGTRISSWIPRDAFGADPVLANDAAQHPRDDSPAHAAAHAAWREERARFDHENHLREARGETCAPYTREMFQGPPGPRSLFFPGGAFEAMIQPLATLPFRGVIWYQGESDAETPDGYSSRLERLLQSWRTLFANPALPFVIVGLPNFTGDENARHWPAIRAQQREVATRGSDVQFVDTTDLGEAANLHPSNKSDFAARILPTLLTLLQKS